MKHTKLCLAFLAAAFATSSLFTSCKDEDKDPVTINTNEEDLPFYVHKGSLSFIFYTTYGVKDTTGIKTDSLYYYYDNPAAAGIPEDNIVYVGKMYHVYNSNGTEIYKQNTDGSWHKELYPSQDGPTYWKVEGRYIVYESNNEKLFLIRRYDFDRKEVISELSKLE